jgi:hypothetical protein
VKKLILFTLITCIALTWSCKKYEDDTYWFTLRTVRQRIEGKKEMVMYNFGNIDLMPQWHNRLGDFYLDFTTEKYNPHSSAAGFKLMAYNKASDSLVCEGQWWFSSDKYIPFHLDCLDDYSTLPLPKNIRGGEGKIVKLSNKEMWLKGEGYDPAQGWDPQIGIPTPVEIRFVQYKN